MTDQPAAARSPQGKLNRGGYSWSIFEGGQDPYVILITIYIFMPYVAATMVGDAVKGQALISQWQQWAGWAVMATAPFIGASIDKLGRRKGFMGLIVGLMIPLTAALWWAKPDGSGLSITLTMLCAMTVQVLFNYAGILHNSLLVRAAGLGGAHKASGLALSLGNLFSVLALAFTAWAFALPGKVDWAWVPATPLFGLNTATHEHERVGIDEFEDFVCAMIPEQIPVVYLEGYAQLGRQADALPWPARPKVIFTSNLYQFNEVFQIWAAKKIEAGAPLVIGQHGGIMGVGKWVPGEDHQVDIADRYLTWGWRDGRPQTLPALAFTIVNRATGKWNPQGKILLVSSPMRVYSYRSSSWPVGPNQSAQFIAEQLGFARALDAAVRARLLLRINTRQDRKTSCFYTEQWRDEFPGVEIDDSTQPIEKCLSQCRLFVYSFNSTGFLETLGRNIPTVIFWNPRYFELRSDAQPFFDRLKAVGIFHDNPESAARHISGIWADVAGWWNQAVVQEARRHFCARFAHTSKKPVRELSKSLAAICRS